MREIGLGVTIVLMIAAAPLVHTLAQRAGRSGVYAAIDGAGVLAALVLLGIMEAGALGLAGYPRWEAVEIASSWPMTLTALVVLDAAWRFYARRYRYGYR